VLAMDRQHVHSASLAKRGDLRREGNCGKLASRREATAGRKAIVGSCGSNC
jgi:hypothetical protein